MAMKFALAGVLTLPLLAAASASLRATTGLNATRPLQAACTCACCEAAKPKSAQLSLLSCVPRASDNCGALCSADAAAFAARSDEVDYSRYCLASCQPMSAKEELLCGDKQEEVFVGLAAAAAPAAAPSPMAAQIQGEAAAESLAEAAMLRAARHAREAKQSAAVARRAYEQLAAARLKAAEAAGQKALEDVIIDTRKDASEAAALRAGWEDQQRAHAAQKAVVAAAPYKKAKLQTLSVADAWDQHAGDLTRASRQYEEYAVRQQLQEKKLKEQLQRQGEDSSLMMKLHAAEVNMNEGLKSSQRYEEEAQGARKEADGIRANASWYDKAEVAAAYHAMYSELPKGVTPPLLPTLP